MRSIRTLASSSFSLKLLTRRSKLEWKRRQPGMVTFYRFVLHFWFEDFFLITTRCQTLNPTNDSRTRRFPVCSGPACTAVRSSLWGKRTTTSCLTSTIFLHNCRRSTRRKQTSSPVPVQVETTNRQGNITALCMEISEWKLQDNQGRKHWSQMESNMGGFAPQNLAGFLLWLAVGFDT